MWNYYIRRVEKLSPPKDGQGALYHQVRKEDEQTFRITDCVPAEHIEMVSTEDSSPRFRRKFSLSEAGDSTELVDDFELSTSYPALIEKITGNKVKKAVYDNLNKLKEILETGETVLQDGRRVSIN
jgi:hypothetical protein